jgi:hypothetical protein
MVGTVVTAFLSNDATAVVLTPAVLAVVRRAKGTFDEETEGYLSVRHRSWAATTRLKPLLCQRKFFAQKLVV